MTVGAALSILSAILGIAKWWLAWMDKRKYIEQGQKDAILANLQGANEHIDAAVAARDGVRVQRERGGLLPDDGHLRPDEPKQGPPVS